MLSRISEALQAYEFDTFVVGFSRDANYSRDVHEERFRRQKVKLGLGLEKTFPGARVDFDRPDVRVQICADGEVKLTVAPLFVGGRYRKLSRRVTASRWLHHLCHGKGCASCGYTGNLCGPSVEELVGTLLLEESQGSAVFFHALGREDTDVRMLGAGRPFVMEVRHPRRRTMPLDEVADRTNEDAGGTIEVFSLALVEREMIRILKESAAPKAYRAWVRCDAPPPTDAFDRVARLADTTVQQLSPDRVKRRKGERTCRTKRIFASTWLGAIHNRYVWEVSVESGTYVKELVSGDDGRTRPSLGEALGVGCVCSALDVTSIDWQPPWET